MRNLFIVIDGLGYDQITHFTPAGLIDRGRQTGLIPLTTLLTYSSGIYPSIWTGQYPDQHNVWTEFYRRDTARVALTAPLQLVPGKYLPRKMAYVGLSIVKRLGIQCPDYYGIPPQIQSQFGRVQSRYEALPPVDLPTASLISRVIEQSGQSWEYVFCDKLDHDSERKLRDAAARVDTLIVCFAEIDEAGHHLGPMSEPFGETLRAFDRQLLRLVNDLEQTSPDVATFFFSDHGMTTVTDQFDAWSYLEGEGFRLGRDYLAFINSTIISLWFDGENQREVIAALNTSGYGRVLTDNERIEYHVHFQDRRYGDVFFVANEGIEFIPNFISLARRTNPGMHGYNPLCSSTRSFFIGGAQVKTQPQDVVGLYDVLVETTFAANSVM